MCRTVELRLKDLALNSKHKLNTQGRGGSVVGSVPLVESHSSRHVGTLG